MRVQISDLSKDDKPYWAGSVRDCRDETDRSAYELAMELDDVITMGTVIACPERFSKRVEEVVVNYS